MSVLLLPPLLLLGLVLPAWGVLAGTIISSVLSLAGLVPPVAELGALKVRAHDPLLLAATLRTVYSLSHRSIHGLGPASRALIGWIAVLIVMLLVATARFGAGSLATSWPPLLRLALECALAPFLALELAGESDEGAVRRVLLWLGAFACGNILLARIAIASGWSAGEAFALQDGTVRAFGLIGDQVSLLLVFFILWAIADGAVVRLGVALLSLLLTGGLGALATLGIATIALLFLARTRMALLPGLQGWIRPERIALLTLSVVILLPIAAATILARVNDPALLVSGSGFQRIWTAGLALDVVREHPFLGIGFLAFSQRAFDAGAAILFVQQSGLDSFSNGFIANASNQYLETLLDAGIPGLIGLAVLLLASVRALLSAVATASPQSRTFLLAGAAWVLGLAVGNQTAVWLLPGSLLALIFCVLIGSTPGLVPSVAVVPAGTNA